MIGSNESCSLADINMASFFWIVPVLMNVTILGPLSIQIIMLHTDLADKDTHTH